MRNIKILSAAVLLISANIEAQAANIAFGKQYAYFDNTPGEGPYYLDEGHSSGLGVFSTGQLTDGIVQTGIPADQALIPSPDVSFYGTPGRIIFDLGGIFAINSIDLGTNRYGNLANFRPENVNLLFSTIGLLTSDFSTPVYWDIPTDTTDGQRTFSYALGTPVSARYVQLDFHTPGQPTTEIHFDEVAINGTQVVTVPEPASWFLIGIGFAGIRVLRRANNWGQE